MRLKFHLALPHLRILTDSNTYRWWLSKLFYSSNGKQWETSNTFQRVKLNPAVTDRRGGGIASASPWRGIHIWFLVSWTTDVFLIPSSWLLGSWLLGCLLYDQLHLKIIISWIMIGTAVEVIKQLGCTHNSSKLHITSGKFSNQITEKNKYGLYFVYWCFPKFI